MDTNAERVGRMSMSLIDKLESTYDDGTDPKVIQLLFLAEVEYTDEDNDRASGFLYATDEDRPVAQIGLIEVIRKRVQG